VFVWLKSAAFVPVIVILGLVRFPVPLLVRKTFLATLAMLISRLLKATEVGDRVTPGLFVVTVVVMVVELFAGSGSARLLVTVTVLLRVGPADVATLTVTVRTADAPEASVPSAQVIVPVPPTEGGVQEPWVVPTEPKVVPVGVEPLRVTAGAEAGPALSAVMV